MKNRSKLEKQCLKNINKSKGPSKRDMGFCNACFITSKLGEAMAFMIKRAKKKVNSCPYVNEYRTSDDSYNGKVYRHKCDYYKKRKPEKQD